MKVIRREFYGVKRSQTFTVIPLGDIHLGNAACDEKLLKKVIKRIADDDDCLWIGLGDYAEFINRRDPRFDPRSLADWIELHDLVDLSQVQVDRLCDYLKPIMPKCLALIEGNHESAITHHYERAIYAEIVARTKQEMRTVDHIGLGMMGWLQLIFRRGDGNKKRGGTTIINISLHHGFVGGRLAGAKALNMQRWLWSHDCDIAIFGHSHNSMNQIERTIGLNAKGQLVKKRKYGLYSGTFLDTATEGIVTYAERRGYLPTPIGGSEIILRPGATQWRDRIKVLM